MKASIRFVLGVNQFVEFEGEIEQGGEKPITKKQDMAILLLEQEIKINKSEARVHIFLK